MGSHYLNILLYCWQNQFSNDDIQKNENPVTTLAVGDIVVFGKYEQDNNPDNGTEPIEWIVLDTKDNQVWLLSRYGLDAKPFGTGVFASDWEDSSLREWLNNDFYNQAFSDEEKESIRESVVLNNENHIKKETRNKVFVLSREEIKSVPIGERTCKVTEYAKNAGSYYADSDGNGIWWNRTWREDYGKYTVYSVDNKGEEDWRRPDQLLYVRPSIQISWEAAVTRKTGNASSPAENAASEATSADSETDVPDYYQGTVQNNVYENKYLGIAFSFSGWEMVTEENMAAIRQSNKDGIYSFFSEMGYGDYDTVIRFRSSEIGSAEIVVIKPASEDHDKFLNEQLEAVKALMQAYYIPDYESTLTKCYIDGKEADAIRTVVMNNKYYDYAFYKINDLYVRISIESNTDRLVEVLSRLHWI